jgi:hypothetical protein
MLPACFVSRGKAETESSLIMQITWVRPLVRLKLAGNSPNNYRGPFLMVEAK